MRDGEYFFFFQAEDGIRDWSVTGVQTCALPIYSESGNRVVAALYARVWTVCSALREVSRQRERHARQIQNHTGRLRARDVARHRDAEAKATLRRHISVPIRTMEQAPANR